MLGEREGHLAVGVVQVAQQVGHPHRAVLDRCDPQRGKPLEHAVADDRGERLGDAAVGEGNQRERRVPEALEPAASLAGRRGTPELAVVRRATQACVDHERHARLGDSCPDAVELRVAGRQVAAVAVGDRTGDGHEHPGPQPEHPVDLGLGQVGLRERDHRGGEQALVAAVESPVLVEPAVERPEGGLQRGQVAAQRLLHADPEGREEQRSVESLPVELGDACRSVAILRVLRDRVEVAEHRLQVEALGIAAAEVVLEAAGRGDRIERGVRDELVDPAPYEQAPLAPDLGPLHAALGHLRVDVARERVLRLVVVVVGVEGAELELAHGRSLRVSDTRVS